MLPGALATAAQANFLSSDDGAFLNQRVVEMVTQLRQQQPGISDAQLSNTMNAAFCPAVANRSDLSISPSAMLVRLNTLVQNQIAAAVPTQGSVVASVPLAPSVARNLNNAAAASISRPPPTWRTCSRRRPAGNRKAAANAAKRPASRRMGPGGNRI